MASRLINKQSGMEGQIRDVCGGGAEKRRVGTGGGHWQMMRDCKVSMQYMVCEQNVDHVQSGVCNMIHIYEKLFDILSI